MRAPELTLRFHRNNVIAETRDREHEFHFVLHQGGPTHVLPPAVEAPVSAIPIIGSQLYGAHIKPVWVGRNPLDDGLGGW